MQQDELPYPLKKGYKKLSREKNGTLPAYFSCFFEIFQPYRLKNKTHCGILEKNRSNKIHHIDDIMRIMSSIFFVPVQARDDAGHRFPSYKSGWYQCCCGLVNRPDGQYPSPHRKRCGRKDAADCEETLSAAVLPRVDRESAYRARCWSD